MIYTPIKRAVDAASEIARLYEIVVDLFAMTNRRKPSPTR